MTTSATARIGAQRHPLAIGIIGGPTTVIDFGGLRLVTEPTFDAPRDYGAYRKETGPAVRPEELGPVDAVLLSHDLHQDNFDHAGRDFARSAPLLLTGPQAAQRLGGNARGLRSFDATELRASGDARPCACPRYPRSTGRRTASATSTATSTPR
ncbi:MBL fold metallo-hydrolase [Mycolicibacterium mageritense]|uniref:MBL fold metallo-hydrolase n=1 Tax=Mycolicibacterium mageritense TaxID=53462 RepID=UPI001E412DB8|nr:hypothetical protein [Mycolicibacterium mageritense]MCC9179251.1 hypothetical protein [Mycolicibacterium mageritense]